ncbi:hypothetical protein [Actinoallomurus sp. NPDC050550]|uniref:hypothetical protein n=1 Tax=Actinoallomurus sp. NPDC050550 TaxID=3154937 RepID=UPI0033EB589E
MPPDTDGQEGELEAARRAFDAIAAARVSPDESGRRMPCIRGGTPDHDEWERAVRAARPDVVPESVLAEILRQAVATLNGSDRLTVIEVTDKGIGATQVGVGPLGWLEVMSARDLASWTDLLPTLSPDPIVRSFQLAGGVAAFDHEQLWATLEDALAALIRTSRPVVITSTVSGWTLPERAVAFLARRYEPAASVRVSSMSSGPQLERLVEDSPLHQPYELVVAAVHPASREVMLQSRQLFPVGARPGDETVLPVRCVSSDENGTVLATVTWHDGDPRLLSINSVKLRPGTYRLRAVLDGPARVRFVEPAGVAPDERRWSELLSLIPERLEPSVAAVDLVCGVELGGGREAVDARLRLIRELIKILDEECSEPDLLRIAILGYGDHPLDSRLDDRRVVRGAWLAPAAEALTTLARLRAVESEYHEAAPVEDMLFEAVGRIVRTTGVRKTVLMTVGGRPPHPPRASESRVLPCPYGHDSGKLLRTLERNTDVSRIAIVDRLNARDRPTWHRLGAKALYELPEAEPRRLGVDIGVLVPRVQRLPFPLFDQE